MTTTEPLRNKKVILAITGSIAAYKAATLARLFIKAGAEVRVLMTPSATEFISPLTLSTLSGHAVATDVSDGETWNNHVELGLWADILLVAPCTATTLGKMAAGICDTMVLATYLSAKCPVLVAPAMDLDMWHHPATQHNLKTIQSYGNTVIPVGYGELASGLVGEGRMAEPQEIVDFVADYLTPSQILLGKTVVVTAGPTYESLDPVRFIGNHSTGTMGVEIARAAAALGATVHLVLGPSKVPVPDGIHVDHVQSAQQMYEVTAALHSSCDVAIFSAAVADYRPVQISSSKIKKADDDLSIALERTIDIAQTLGSRKKPQQIHVGFALETDNEIPNAQGKLRRKNFDLIVLNSLNDAGAGFGNTTNKVTVIDTKGDVQSFALMQKSELASKLIDRLVTMLNA